MKEFVKQTITIPSDLVAITNGEEHVMGDVPDLPVMIFFHDSLSCSSCQIAHLADIQSIYELSDSLGTFEVMTIFSPSLKEYDDVLRELKMRKFRYTIYIDKLGSFGLLNSFIPLDERFHNFLINEYKYPAYVGNPVGNNQLHDLFIESINHL